MNIQPWICELLKMIECSWHICIVYVASKKLEKTSQQYTLYSVNLKVQCRVSCLFLDNINLRRSNCRLPKRMRRECAFWYAAAAGATVRKTSLGVELFSQAEIGHEIFF
ncbi:hypothetical protein ABEB36_003165 [Hypothenemus hampei]|uniref:Uncharacterized protein n=1 Tax=Hypothenemus hampei TaxID=57062 RepID=A0ABD1F893_HYPHA